MASSDVGDRGEQVALAHGRAGGAADADLPAALDGDEADVLDVRLGAVARAAGHRRLDLVRRGRALHRRSSSIPTPIASPSPKRQKSVPTHVFTVRTAFA